VKSDEYIEKALRNIESDREKLQHLYDDLEQLKTSDPFVVQSISDNLVKVVDSLTKQNGQLVDLAKLKQKAECFGKSDEEFTDADYEELYNVITKSTETDVVVVKKDD